MLKNIYQVCFTFLLSLLVFGFVFGLATKSDASNYYYSWYPDTLALAPGDSFHIELMLNNDTTLLSGYGFTYQITPTAPFDTLTFDWTGTAADTGNLVPIGPEYDPGTREYGGVAYAMACDPGVPLGTWVAIHIYGQIRPDAAVGLYTFVPTNVQIADCDAQDLPVTGYDGIIRVLAPVEDVGPTGIISPPDTVYPDSSYVPQASVQNFEADSAGPIPVICTIDTNGNRIYIDTTEIATLAGGDIDTVSFADWTVPTGGIDYTVTVWTAYPGDSVPLNDTISTVVYAFEPISGFYYSWYPDTLTLAPGDSFHIELMLTNDTTTLSAYGFYYQITPAAPFDTLTFDWTGTAADTGNLTGLGPEYDPGTREYGGVAYAMECDPGVPLGTWVAIHIYGQIRPDAAVGLYTFVPTNVQMADCDTRDIPVSGYDGVIRIQGLSGDVGATDITSPPETVYVDSSYTPQAIAQNFGPDAAGPIPVICAIDTNGNQVYIDTTEITTLAGGDIDTVSFADWTVPTGDIDYTVTVWTAYPGDPQSLNDTTSTVVYAVLVGVWEQLIRPPIPMSYGLFQSYPNPMSSKATIFYQIPKTSLVTLKIYDTSGRVVRTLVEWPQEPGYYIVQWDGRTEDGRKVASGVYFYRMKAGEFTSLKKLVVIR